MSPSTSQSPVLTHDLSAIYGPRLQLLLREIKHRHEAPTPPNPDFHDAFRIWFENILRPALSGSWTAQKAAALSNASSSFAERVYAFADPEMLLLIAKLMATVLVIDDAIDDEDEVELYKELSTFTRRIILGEAQARGVSAIYHGLVQEVYTAYEGDKVLAGMAVAAWSGFVDACLLERRVRTVEVGVRASPLDSGYHRLSMQQKYHGTQSPVSTSSEWAAINFPLYLRHKTAIGEAYAIAVFKASKSQQLPLTRFIKALPDISLYMALMNDILSFHKEQLSGDTFNYIHLRTQVLRHTPANASGSGPCGEWTVLDTFNLLCSEARDAAARIDVLLRVEELEGCTSETKRGLDSGDGAENVSAAMDAAIARQWRGFRDGSISWHLESARYKLDFIKSQPGEVCK